MAMPEPMALDLYADPVRADPYPLLEELREAAPLHWVSQHRGLESWIVTRYDVARAVLADPRFVQAPATVRVALRRF
jgi:cytochrome P450